MATKDLSAGMRRAVGYGAAVTVALGSALFLFNFVVDRVIDEVEVVIQPCQHGGAWVPTLEKCSCVGPWSGPYCSDCTCENNGVCDQNNINVPFTGTLWGCRCPDNWLGSLCDLCTTNRTNEERCVGKCLPDYSGSRCETTCVAGATFESMLINTLGRYDDEIDLWVAGGEVNACSGHGSCDYANECDCDLPTWFPSADGRSQCARTCAVDSAGQLCYGHGACTNINNIVGCVCEDGWHLNSDCSVPCPGMDIWVQQSCSGRGICSLENGIPACECLDLHLGEACQYKCPTNEDGDSSVACNGHGVCSMDNLSPFRKAACACASGWVGESCQCNDAQTCSGHGTCMDNGKCACDEFWKGQRCNACVRGRFGSQCTLQCDERKATHASTPADSIGCNSRGVCAISNFARANEKVVCGCAGNFDTETHCRDCKEFYYPKIGESGLSGADEDAEIACTAFANRASCNFAGEPKLGFSSPASSGPPCTCDQPHANADSFCTVCHETFYPDGGDMSDPSKCTKRCVDKPNQATWYPDVFTLVCKNRAVCDPRGDVCVCENGYSGRDCGIACGGETPCSGHGSCVSNNLQQFMSAEVKNSVSGGTSHMCSCDPQPALGDNEKLKVFTGEEVLGGDAVKNVIEYTGDFCEYSCLKPPWLDAITCNGEACALLPIVDNQGSPIITDCTQDSDCGDWNSTSGRVVFTDENGNERTNLTPSELELRGQVSVQNRWSARMGPFCHVPTVPLSIHVANMKCVQRVNSDSVDETTEANCEEQLTRVKCQAQGGTCRWADACKEALDSVDEFSYCFELLRTDRPKALRSENCTSSCDVVRLQELDWAQVCDHYTSRTPDQFATCGSDLDELCVAGADATAIAVACAGTLPLEADTMAATLSAQDAAAACFEFSAQTDAMGYPFGFEPLLDTTEARNLQAGFHPAFVDIGRKHACVNQKYPLKLVCSGLQSFNYYYMLFDTPAPPLYMCELDAGETLGTIDLSGTNIFCKTYRTVRDINPFRLDCGNSVKDLQGFSVLEALGEALSLGCSLVPKSNIHSSGVAVTEEEASAVCRMVLEDELPNNCKEVCGDDPCTSVGTNAQNVHIFECERPDPTTVSSESCLMGVFSLTGAEGGAVYRCAVPAGDLTPRCSINYLNCQDTLSLHVDQIGEDDPAQGTATVSGILGHQSVLRDGDMWRVKAAILADVVRVEFDVRVVSERRGTISLLSEDGGVIASLLLHHFGGRGWNLNGQSEAEAQPCAAGEGDACKSAVAVNEYYRVVLEISHNQVRAYFGDDELVLKDRAAGVTQTLSSITVSGSAQLKQVFAFSEVSAYSTDACDYQTICSSLYRKTGRAATWRESAKDTLNGTLAHTVSTLGYCANREQSVAVSSNCTWGTSAEHDAVFSAPWHKLCAYHDYAAGLGNCTTQPSRGAVVGCAPVLSKFDSAGCARNATAFDWEQEYCKPLRNDTSPSLLSEIGCDSECLAEVERSDLRSFCDDRSLYWNGSEVVPRVPEGCVKDDAAKTRWRNEDWKQFCVEKASNTAKGVCSAATCDCTLNGGYLSGASCELSCVIGSDGSACNEDSFSGVCDYSSSFTAQVDAYYAQESNLVINHRASEIQGECRCANSKALAREGCDVTCDTEDGEQLCNNRTYADHGGNWSISACHVGGTGVCACLPRLTRQITKNVSDWRGNKATVLSFEYGGMPYSSSWQEEFRLRSSQGAQSLMINYYNYTQSTWKGARQKFELEPALFMCGNNSCDFSDVVLAQNLYGTSSFYGPTCSRRCPSVDTGETLELLAYDCVSDSSKLLGADRLTLEACKSECLDNWKCNYIRFDSKTSDCRVYETCTNTTVQETNTTVQETNIDFFWYGRELTGTPYLIPCSGRGRCTPQGACVCESAKYLSLTDPITGARMRTGANEIGSLQNIPVTSLDTTGFRGSDCSKVCPGFDPTESDMSKTCSGHGICTRAATCQCAVGFTGINCELPCPRLLNEEGEVKTTCSGHGTCFESRVNPVGAVVETEDVLQHYRLTEGWRLWYNLCSDNTPLKYLILPFGNYPGTLDQAQIRGGLGCNLVPQTAEDDVTKTFIQRPEVQLQDLQDFNPSDEERDMDAEVDFTVQGTSIDPSHNREGVYRRRYWQESGNWTSQTLFVENFTIVQIENSTKYEQYRGFSCCDPDSSCATMTVGARITGIQTVGECAQACEGEPECDCFDYQEFYHSAFLGGCRLVRQGSLYAYPIHRALQLGAENGLMQKDLQGDLIAFDNFDGSFIVLQDSKSCRAPLITIADSVFSVAACAQLCADRYDKGCVYFTYVPTVLRCSQVKTSSSNCPEGFSTDPSGFFAVTVVNQGATAPVAYDSVGSTRLFPQGKTRGTISGLYYGRARPDWIIAAAQCSCSKSYAYGWWQGLACQTCDVWFGGSACTRRCPGMVAGQPCWGNGDCLWGSIDGKGVPGTFFDAVCLCGLPAAPKKTDLSLSGTWTVTHYDLYQKSTFSKINSLTSFFENPNNYGFADAQCRGCIEKRGGINCAATCSTCLFSGSCQFSISESISVPCLCTSQYYDSQNGCAPHGWILDEQTISADVGGLQAALRARRLETQPGLDVAVGTFYDKANFPDVQTSMFPSRRFTMPCPNVNEAGSWMKDLSAAPSRACKRAGQCRDAGPRKLKLPGMPPRYFPLACYELGEDWASSSRDLFFTYEEKITTNGSTSSEMTYFGEGPNAGADYSDPQYDNLSISEFVKGCRQQCTSLGNCAAVVVKRLYGTKKAWCYYSANSVVVSPSPGFMLIDPNAMFTTYQLKREYDFCVNGLNWCSLGSVSYGDIDLCADVALQKQGEDSTSDSGLQTATLTMGNLGKRCEVDVSTVAGTTDWRVKSGTDCDVSDNSKVRVHGESSAVLDYAPGANAMVLGAFNTSKFSVSAAKVSAAFGKMRPENPCSAREGYFWNVDDRTTCKNLDTGDTCDIKDWKTCLGKQFDSNKTSVHSVHERRAMLPHRLLVDGADSEVTLIKAEFNWNIRTVNSASIQAQIGTLEEDLRKTKSWLGGLFRPAYNTLTDAYNVQKTGFDAAMVAYDNYYPACCDVNEYTCYFNFGSVCPQWQVLADEVAKWDIVTTKEDMDTAGDIVHDYEDQITNIEKSIADLNTDKQSNEEDMSCTSAQQCDVCQGNCQSDDECLEGLVCYEKGTAMTGGAVQIPTYSCNSADMPGSGNKYCVHDPTMLTSEKDNYETFIAGYVSQPGVYTSKVVAVDPTSRVVVLQFAESHNVLTDLENTPSSSASIVSKRASALLTQSVISATVAGYATLEGTAGLVPRPEKSLLDANEPRTFRTDSAQGCRLLCEETAGCTAASAKTQVNLQGDALYKCTLHTVLLPENVDCDSALLVDLEGLSAQTMLLKPERCGLCKVMGMLTAETANPSQVHCAKRNKPSDYCEVFPTGSVGVTTTYAWSDRMCAPVRSGFDKMYTSVVMVGKSFKLDEVSPYLTIDGHPDIQTFSQCESLCAEDRKCAAWHFRDLLSPQRGDDHVDHVCELFSYVPPVISTSSALENVFSGRTRIGIVQRDFSADLDVFADDGNNAACLCGDDTDAEGYDCGCKAISPTPYTGVVLNDNVWGCSGHGRCGGTGYFCACDEGYEFAWGAEQNNLPAGFTCRPCAAGQFKNSDVEHCTPCPVGSYQTQAGMSQCTACPQNNPSTPTTGAVASLECMSCPVGRVAGTMANSGHTKPLNSNYNDATTLCTPCAVGKFDSGFATIQTQLLRFVTGQQRVCRNCPGGYTTSTYGMGYCDVDIFPGECNEPGMAWEHPDDEDPEILGGARCMLCPQGRYKSENNVVCQSCPIGFSTPTVGGTNCAGCPLGYFAAEEAQMGCDQCPSGYYQSQVGKAACELCAAGTFSATKAGVCEFCGAGKYNNDSAQSSCKECESGKYQVQTGQSSCSNCDAGKYQSLVGQNSENACKGCGHGTYSAAGRAECTDCAAGKYQNAWAQVSVHACKDCESGKYNNQGGQYLCKLCSAGKYQDSTAQTSESACKDCEAGKNQKEEGKQGCKDCEVGTYSNEIGLGQDCKSCPGGTYNDQTANTTLASCKDCQSGKYAGTGYDRCRFCDNGKEPNSGQNGCQACGDGKYSDANTGVGVCLICPVGFYNSATRCKVYGVSHKECCNCYYNVYSNYQDEEGQGSCKQCPTGKSHFEDGLVFKGCADCPVGKYQNEPPKKLNFGYDDASAGCKACTAETYQNEEGQTDCKTCPSGFNTKSDGTGCDSCPIGYDRDMTDDAGLPCQPCAAGKYSDELSEDACKVCPAETYQNDTGGASCKDCQAESVFFYQDEVAQTSCKICPAPSQIDPDNAVALSSCRCPEGWYATGQTGAWASCELGTDCPCMVCPPDQFTDTKGAAACKTCPSGFHNLQWVQTKCIANPVCEAGKRTFDPTSQDGDTRTSLYCGDCHEGTYNSLAGSNSCDDCVAGKYQDEMGGTACKLCPAGFVATLYSVNIPVADRTRCGACDSGTYQNEEAQTDCKHCLLGFYSPNTGRATCEPCQPGFFSLHVSSVECTACAAGKYNGQIGQAACAPCPTGSHAASTGAAACAPCPAGSYAASTGVAVCTPCPTGTYQNVPGDLVCEDCAAGKYNGQTGQDACAPCPAGSYAANTGAAACTPCPAGTYQNVAGNLVCEYCAAGKYNGQTGQAACTPCATGTYNSQTGQDACTPCLAGTYQNVPGDLVCEYCAAGKYNGQTGQDACTPCATGTYNSETGQDACTPCPAGKYNGQTGQDACTPCPAGTSQYVPGSVACEECNPGRYGTVTGANDVWACKVCEVGKYGSSTGAVACADCDAGRYSMNPEQVSNAACLACPAGRYAASTGAKACTACDPGYYQDEEEKTSCKGCLSGGYQDRGAKRDCKTCPSGWYGSSTGAVACADCDAGRYSQNPEQVSNAACLACPAGRYAASTGAAACTACDPGYYQNEEAQTECKTCPSGYEANTDKDGCNICPANTFTQPYFLVTSGSSCSATVNAESITTLDECTVARTALGLDYSGSNVVKGSVEGDEDGYASGCISSHTGSTVFLNIDPYSFGDCGYSGYNCICKSSNPVTTTCTDCPSGKYSAAGSSACKIPPIELQMLDTYNDGWDGFQLNVGGVIYTLEVGGDKTIEITDAAGIIDVKVENFGRYPAEVSFKIKCKESGEILLSSPRVFNPSSWQITNTCD